MLKLSFIGNLGQDARISTLGSGDPVINFSVGVTKTWKDKEGNKKEETTWINCSYFRDSNVSDFLLKGTKVYIEGEPKARIYDGKKGPEISMDVRVSTLELLGGKKNDSAESNGNASGEHVPGDIDADLKASQEADPWETPEEKEARLAGLGEMPEANASSTAETNGTAAGEKPNIFKRRLDAEKKEKLKNTANA